MDGIELKLGEQYELVYLTSQGSIVIRPLANNRKHNDHVILVNVDISQQRAIDKIYSLGSSHASLVPRCPITVKIGLEFST